MINIVDSLTCTIKFIYLLKIIYYNLGGDKMLFQLFCTLFGIEKKSTHKENKKIYKDIKKGRDKDGNKRRSSSSKYYKFR